MSGALILAGSGEFTPAMNEVDRAILSALGPRARVAIVPTAAGQEDTAPRWATMGSEHFAALGAEPVGVMVLDRDAAHDPRWTESIADASWIYFSGGDPAYAVATLEGTPFWDAVLARHRSGAVLAGSSAGAMLLGGSTFVPLGRRPDGLPRSMEVRSGLGVVPRVIVAPHYDIVPPPLVASWARLVPADHVLVGIDEDTVLLRDAAGWRVDGRATVTIARGDGPLVLRAGDRVAGGLLP